MRPGRRRPHRVRRRDRLRSSATLTSRRYSRRSRNAFLKPSGERDEKLLAWVARAFRACAARDDNGAAGVDTAHAAHTLTGRAFPDRFIRYRTAARSEATVLRV